MNHDHATTPRPADVVSSLLVIVAVFAGLAAAPAHAQQSPPFKYVWAKAWHILPETTTDESGYFSLNEGLNGLIYVGSAAYGRNAYLVEVDPTSDKQRIVVDAHKLLGLPLEPTGYAAQAKFHTRNFVGPSGTIYVGTKQGYPTEADKANNVIYPGGYVITYDPKTDKAVNHGQPMPWGDATRALGYTEGEGVIDTVADEDRGLIYVVTCENQHWFRYDMKAGTYHEIDPSIRLTPYGTTLIEPSGRANAITKDGKLARYEPDAQKLTIEEMVFPDGSFFDASLMKGTLTWILAPDGSTVYLIAMTRPNLYKIALDGPGEDPKQTGTKRVPIVDLGPMLGGSGHDSRSSLTLSRDGKVYAIIKVNNETGYGSGPLHHIASFDPATSTMRDHGVLAVKNPDFYNWNYRGPDGKPKPWTHGYHRLPDNTLTPLHAHMGLIAASDGSLYATILYPYTLLRIEPEALK